MIWSSCLSAEDRELILDSSVVINLLATGHPASILRALPLAIVVTENVKREIELGAITGRSERQQLSRLVDDGLVRIAQLEGETLETFFDLVSGSAVESLGDGESATLAFAYRHSRSAAIDEKKATRIAAARFSSLRLATTVDILAHPDVGAALGDDKLAGAVFSALTEARMQVREHQFGWVANLIGSERIAACASLRRLAVREHRRNNFATSR
jgi:predicted nucleic acid-binding protein